MNEQNRKSGPRGSSPARGPRPGASRAGAERGERRGSGFQRDERGPARGGFRPRGEGAPPSRGGFRPRGDDERGPARGGFRPRGEGAPPSRGGFRPRGDDERGPARGGFRPRGEGAPPSRGGFRPRGDDERGPSRGGFRPRGEGAPPSRGFRPRGDDERGPARGGFRPRGDDERGPARGGFRPRGEGAPPSRGFRPRGDDERGPARGGFRPRGEGAPPSRGFRPRGDDERGPARGGFRPRGEGAPPSRGFRPRGDDERGPARGGFRPRGEGAPPSRGGFRPRGDDQTGAVNRSRPAYDAGQRTRYRRDGKPSVWTKRQRDPVRTAAPFGAAVRGAAETQTDAAAPPLPADPREAALRILFAVESRGAFSDRLLDGAHARGAADPRDRALMHELVKGTLRWRARLDWALDQRVHMGLENTQPWIRNALRLGAYQILFLDRVPAHAAVDESVKLAHLVAHPGAAGLVNSVLRRLAEEKDSLDWPAGDDAASLAVWGSHPQWLVERWLARFGVEATRELLAANNRPIPVGLRVNAVRGTRERLMQRLASEGVESRAAELSPDLVWVEGHHAPGGLAAFRDGWCTAQDESESLVGRLVDPQPHERLLDLCAAPGGKSTHLAELIRDDGEVWAMERDPHRVAALEATISRLGMHSIHVVHGDGRSYAFPMPFDRVLVDAPCSGLGVLGRRADARWRKGPGVVDELAHVQLELLASGGRRLRPGGLLVYSVCSFEPEENEQVIERFLAENPQFRLESAAGHVPDAVVTPEGTMRVLPHVHGCDGAFAARFRKS